MWEESATLTAMKTATLTIAQTTSKVTHVKIAEAEVILYKKQKQ